MKIAVIFLLSTFLYLSLTSSKPIQGEYRYYEWILRHGFYGSIKINKNKMTKCNWSSNFFYPTQIKIKGDYEIIKDTLMFYPQRISFYRRKEGKYKKIKSPCDILEMNKIIDREKEGYLLDYCEKQLFEIKGDTIIELQFGRSYVNKN